LLSKSSGGPRRAVRYSRRYWSTLVAVVLATGAQARIHAPSHRGEQVREPPDTRSGLAGAAATSADCGAVGANLGLRAHPIASPDGNPRSCRRRLRRGAEDELSAALGGFAEAAADGDAAAEHRHRTDAARPRFLHFAGLLCPLRSLLLWLAYLCCVIVRSSPRLRRTPTASKCACATTPKMAEQSVARRHIQTSRCRVRHRPGLMSQV